MLNKDGFIFVYGIDSLDSLKDLNKYSKTYKDKF